MYNNIYWKSSRDRKVQLIFKCMEKQHQEGGGHGKRKRITVDEELQDEVGKKDT